MCSSLNTIAIVLSGLYMNTFNFRPFCQSRFIRSKFFSYDHELWLESFSWSLFKQHDFYKPQTSKLSKRNFKNCLQFIADWVSTKDCSNIINIRYRVKHIKLEFDKDSVKVGKESFNSLSEMTKFYKTSVPVSLVTEPVFLVEEIDSQGLPTHFPFH